MTCAEAKLKLEPCVSGTLAPEERVELEEHLATCEGCRLELELTRAVMGASSVEGTDGPAAAVPDVPPSEPHQQEARPPTPVYDEVSFENLGSESPSAGSTADVQPVAAAKVPDPSEADPFATFTTKPDEPAAATWDFEPAEVPRDSGPPEGSLSFANEALKRKREVEKKRKATLVRLALWGGGIGCGLVLLGISVWIALAFRQEKAPELPPAGVTPSQAPPAETTTPVPPEPTTTPNASDGSAAPPPVTTEPTASTPQAPTAQAPTPSAPTLLDATPGVAPSPGPPPPDIRVAADGSTKSGSRATKPKPKPGAKVATKPTSGSTARMAGDEGEFPWTPVDDPPPARTREPAFTAPPPVVPVKPPDSGTTAPPSPLPQPKVEPAPPAPEPAPTKPIDRLHLATETAAKNADLVTLRKLKSSWKSLIGSTAGPDRTRAKREYADCLWSIAEISGRNSDRREALTAYRDYVLYAPAGGTDSRTVSRMRFLEDILTDSK